MDDENKASMEACRKLLLGELVEVRQKEIGLRGSWHPAKVVRVKYGRRVVEYDDLLTPDHSKKLQESVYLCNDIEPHSTTLRKKNFTKAKPEKRGFVRPRPPSCSTPPPKYWKRGLLVDAFYDGAWWEGILLDDVHFCHTDTKVKVFFPEEGDELRVFISDLRVSQEWDEDSGLWAICGYWSFHSETGRIDLSSLKDICRAHTSPLKKLWRQKRFNSSHILPMEEQREWQLSGMAVSHAQLSSGTGDGGNARQKRGALSCKETILQEATANVGVGPLIEHRADEKLSAGSGCFLEFSRQKANEWHTNQTYANVAVTNQDHLNEQYAKKKENALKKIKERTPEKSRASSRITRNTLTSVQHGFDKVQSSRLCDTKNNSSKDALEVNMMPQKEKLLPASSVDKLSKHDWRVSESSFRNDASNDAEQANPKCNILSLSKRGSCSKSYATDLQDGDLRSNGVFTDCSIPHKVRVRQARLAAKEFLLNAGWRLDVRDRARGRLKKQEVVYISPSGSRFFSLAAACRGWKSFNSHDDSLDRGINKEIELLSTYCMAEDLRYLQKLNNQQGRTEQILMSPGLQEEGGNNPLCLVDSKVSGLLNGAIEVNDRKNLETSSFTSIQVSNCGRGDTKFKKKKSYQHAEIKKKRKSEVLDGFSLSETSSKRGRPPPKRGGCRMQVLLSFPGKSKDLGSLKSAGECTQFKKSTVLSWLMDKGILKENEPVSYINRKDGHVMKKGQVTREGVICDCCKEVFTLSNFEAHAGSKLHRPSANTFLEDGRSISDCQLEACALQDAKEKESLMDINDDTCGVCGDGGDLVLCDHCPSTFHADCIGLEVIPEGDWYCPRCCCGICGSNQLSAHDIDNAMHRCEQCELEYHLICAQGYTVFATGDKLLSWFCDRTCKEIFAALRALVGVSNPMGNGFSWTLLRSMKKDQGLSRSSLLDMAEHHSKLSVAYGVMQECFVPMIDPRTNINLLSQAIYNRRSKVTRLNYAGFYTLLLERGDEIISVATIRVHGARLAEMPLVGTRYQYRRQGMCRRLIYALEEMLRSIGVKKLILPAVPELLDTWMGAFSFIKISPEETRELSKLSLMTFPGTTLLQKYLPASTESKTSACLSHIADKGGPPFESSPHNSVETFLTMARASLDGGAIDGGKAFLTTALDGSGQRFPAKLNVFNYTAKSHHSFLPGDPRTPLTLEGAKCCTHLSANFGKLKSRLKNRDRLESSGNGWTTSKVQKDDDIYSSVVIATTRSNRLVKSRRWVADGLKELKDAKQSKRAFPVPESYLEPEVDIGCRKLFETLVQSDLCQERKNVETFYVRTRRKTPTSVEVADECQAESGQDRDWYCSSVVDSLQSDFRDTNHMKFGVLKSASSLGENESGRLLVEHENSTELTNGDEVSCGSEYAMNDSCMDGPSLNIQLNDELPICAKFYSRRKKREFMLTDSTSDFPKKVTAQDSAEEQGFCPPVKGSLEGLWKNFSLCKEPTG